MEGTPYHSPDVTVSVHQSREEEPAVAAEPGDKGGGEMGGVKPVIPTPPPLPPIMAPVPEEEEEVVSEGESVEGEKVCVCVCVCVLRPSVECMVELSVCWCRRRCCYGDHVYQ